jgi:membrane protease subunit (stomatin/prohibitin family)
MGMGMGMGEGKKSSASSRRQQQQQQVEHPFHRITPARSDPGSRSNIPAPIDTLTLTSRRCLLDNRRDFLLFIT